MNILLTGSTGYIGQRLLPILLEQGHHVYCCTRDPQRFHLPDYHNDQVHVVAVNFLEPSTLDNIPEKIDKAFYLIHSMSSDNANFEELESKTAENFVVSLRKTQVDQVVYLSGITNDDELSRHLKSRQAVESILSSGDFALTTLRAGIIVGSGSASFEIIRDLVEKLPFMIAPKWLKTKSQPIAIRNVLQFLYRVVDYQPAYNQSYDIGGPKILNYREMLLEYAAVRNLKRKIFMVNVLSPRLSSHWLYFVTSTSYRLAKNLVESMKVEVIPQPNDLHEKLGIELISYQDAIKLAFNRIKQQEVVSHWSDAQSTDVLNQGVENLIEVPEYGCFKDIKNIKINNDSKSIEKIWSIGGDQGWYYASFLWELRGLIDKLFGGVGMRRGRKDPNAIHAGEALDFWRVIYANKNDKRLLLYAEMKMPGEAWLEFSIKNDTLHQAATFRPRGIGGRMYWYIFWPFHLFIFRGMAKKIAQ